jgi:hypothetical protein
LEEEVIWINETKDSPKRQKKLRKQINGKFSNIGGADENKYIKNTNSFFLCQKLKLHNWQLLKKGSAP